MHYNRQYQIILKTQVKSSFLNTQLLQQSIVAMICGCEDLKGNIQVH